MIPTFNNRALTSSVSGTVPSGQTERSDTALVVKALATLGPPAAVVHISAQGARRADAAAPATATGPAPVPALARAAGSRRRLSRRPPPGR